ncbi:29551_t:CDS:2 [Racocetra persica]|uniref:29551_t:CDS:1 n=1 Tax=Racocetra persica TaxID=160502 RepID=A0ACA9N0V5_9GLOM|nr:29551_t:CDS:2 [Racocetra persica]
MIIQRIIDSLGITEFFILFGLILTTYIFTFYYNYLTRPNPFPGPLPLPFIGNLYNVVDIKLFYEQCQQKYGDICEIMSNGRRCIIISRPEYMEKFLYPTTYFMKIPYMQGIEELGFHGCGMVFNNDYKSWYYHRQFFTQALLTPKLMDTAINSTKQLFEELSGYWQSLGMQSTLNNNKEANNNWTLETDFSAWFHGFANDIASIVITGERTCAIASYYNTQSIIKSEHAGALVKDGNKFVNATVKFINDIMFYIFVGPFMRHYVPIIRNMTIPMLKNKDYVFERFDMIVKNRRKTIDELPSDTEMKSDMLTSLITANTPRNAIKVKTVDDEMLKPMDDKQIRMNLVEAILGGTDTTSNLFCFMTYYVCKHPHVKQKLLLEIDSVFSKSSVSQEDISKLKYCKAIIKETNRIIPTAFMTTRFTSEEREFSGYKWPADTQLHLNFIAANKHPSIWTNPEIFDPDRFYDDNKYSLKFNDKNLMMFGGSQRICPGRKLAMTELLLLMALVFKNYNVELVNKNEPIKIKTGLIINCEELKVKISPRI